MAMRDLIPRNRDRDVSVRRGEDHPVVALHREMNRLFDVAFRGFDLRHLVRIASSIAWGQQLAQR